jgi:hypothetical protein
MFNLAGAPLNIILIKPNFTRSVFVGIETILGG